MSKSELSPPPAGSQETSRIITITIAFSLVTYVAVMYFLISFAAVSTFTQHYTQIITQHPLLIRFSTSLVCSGCAWFLLWPREGSRFIGRWSDYIGLAFATFAFQYGLRLVELKSKGILNTTSYQQLHDG